MSATNLGSIPLLVEMIPDEALVETVERDMRRANVDEGGEERSAIPEGLQLAMVAEHTKM